MLSLDVPRKGTIRSRCLAGFLREKHPDDAEMSMVEIGVDAGGTAAYLLRQFPNLTTYLVDPYEVYERQPLGASYAALLAMLENTRAVRERRLMLLMPSAQAVRLVPDGSLALVFIDGDHGKPAVVIDLDIWLPKLKPGGIFCGHDYRTGPKVRRRDVADAVDKFAEDHDMKLTLVPDKESRCFIWRLEARNV